MARPCPLRASRAFAYAALAACLLASPSSARAGDVPRVIRFRLDMDVKPHGAAESRVTLSFPPPTMPAIKAAFPDPRRFLLSFRSRRHDSEFAPGATAAYDDAASAIVLRFTALGAARNEGEGAWSMLVDEEDADFVTLAVDEAQRWSAWFYTTSDLDSGVAMRGPTRIALPSAAREARWDAAARAIRWRLDPAPGTGPAKVTVSLRTRGRLMATLHKTYGLGAKYAAQWVGKAVIANEGSGPAHDVRVRWRVEGWSEWSPWERFPEVVPGQAVVSVCYPVLDRSIATVQSDSPANLRIEWRYADVTGRDHEDSDAARLVVLGLRAFAFHHLVAGEHGGSWKDENENAPLLAAWVPRDDAAVNALAAMANRQAGGMSARKSDDAALKALGAAWELVQRTGVGYQSSRVVSGGESFDMSAVQSVRFPRDVLRDRSGTCVELAVLFAGLGHGLGLAPFLVVVPGHVFPAFRLPSGGIGALESTLVSTAGGKVVTFEQAWQAGNRQWAQARGDAKHFLVDVHAMWQSGVNGPDLEPLPPDVIEAWGLGGRSTPAGRPTSVPGPGPAPKAPPLPPPPPAPSPSFDASWAGDLSSTTPDGRPVVWAAELSIRKVGEGGYAATFFARGPWRARDGSLDDAEMNEEMRGSVANGVLTLKGTAMRVRIVATGLSGQVPGDTIEARLVDGALVGRFNVLPLRFSRR